MVALALPLAPLAPGAAAAAGTFVIGSAAFIAQQVHGFRAPLPPLTGSRGKAGEKTLQELVADAIAGARIPVAMPPSPLGPNGSWGVIGLVALAGLIGRGLSQLWGLFNGAKRPASVSAGGWVQLGQVSNVVFTGTARIVYTHSACSGYTGPVPANSSETVYLVTANYGGITSYRLIPGTAGNVETPCGLPGYYVSHLFLLEVGYPDGSTHQWQLGGFNALTSYDKYSTNAAWTINLERQFYGGPVEPAFPPVEVGAAVVPDPLPLPGAPVTPGLTPAAPGVSPPSVPGKSPTPVSPGTAPPPSVSPVSPGVTPLPMPAPGAQPTQDGEVVKAPPLPVVITPPDAHYPVPGRPPVTSGGVRPSIEAVAAEVGRIENKLASIMNPTPDTPSEWFQRLRDFIDLVNNLKDGTEYTIKEQCAPCGDSDAEPAEVKVVAKGATDAFGVITNRLDAIAELLNAQLGLKQKVCPPCPPPPPAGVNISTRFRSGEASPYSGNRLRKLFRYRDQSGKDLALHAQHWEHFTWESGPWMVISEGMPWGKPRVWAKSAEEGKRVIRHAAQIAGVDLTDSRHSWTIRQVSGQRTSPVLLMRIDRSAEGAPWVTTRDGPEGFPDGVLQLPATLGSQVDRD